MDIDHAFVTRGGDDDKAVAIIRLHTLMHLGQSCEEHRNLLFQRNEVRLLFLRIFFVLDPFEPAVRRREYASVWPELIEELAGDDGLDSRVDRVRTLSLRPEWRPAPSDLINAQAIPNRRMISTRVDGATLYRSTGQRS